MARTAAILTAPLRQRPCRADDLEPSLRYVIGGDERVLADEPYEVCE